MGCVQSQAGGGDLAEQAKNRDIENQQRKAAHESEKVIKLMLIGTGDSGKTTLRKQMRRVYGAAYSVKEREAFIPSIVHNLIEGTAHVLYAMNTNLALPLSDPGHRASADLILGLRQPYEFTPPVAAALRLVLQDEAFGQAVKLRSKFQLQDCWDRFAASFQTEAGWGEPGWVPNEDECVASRIRTSGVTEEDLVITGTKFRVYDVGGQRSERRKWIHSFQMVNAILFITAISEYDLVLFEDSKQNRLIEAIELFREITTQGCFQGMPIMLFLNKRDLFEKKFVVDQIPINVSGLFPDAPGNGEGADKAFKWLVRRFEAVKNEKSGDTYPHVTTATDPLNVKRVVDDVVQSVLKNNLQHAGFVS